MGGRCRRGGLAAFELFDLKRKSRCRPAAGTAGRHISDNYNLHLPLKQWHGRTVVDELRQRGIIIRSPSMRGVAEEAPGAYKNIEAVVEAAHLAGMSRKVATLEPLICFKG